MVGTRLGWWRGLLLVSLLFVLHGGANTALAAPNSDDEIVYFDGNNVIRAFDPTPTSEFHQVEWASPDGGWASMAVGDVTGDGDAEIVAIRAEGNGGRLTIFDPVAQDSPDDQVQMLNGIPWAILYDVELEQAPRLLALGEFDLERPGQEILYSFAADDEHDAFVILRSTGEGAPGRAWEVQKSWELEGRWTSVDTGNVHISDAIDEIALASYQSGELGLFRIEPSVVRTFTRVNREYRWTDVALGNYVASTNNGDEIAAVRDANYPLASTWVFRYNGSTFVDHLGEVLLPSPNVAFFVNLRNPVDEELVLLRQVQQELGPRPRLVIRDDNNSDALTLKEALLDGDNEYQGGAGGDIDGDGIGEIVLVRNNRMRIYTEPESSVNYELIERGTNGRSVALGNLDAAGFAANSRMSLSQTSVSAVLPPGGAGGETEITLSDVTKGAILSFSVAVQGAQQWVTISQPDTLTPATFTISFDAANIAPGEYTGSLLVRVAGEDVENDTLVIDLSLRVESIVTATPAPVYFIYDPCVEPLAARSEEVTLSASTPLTYSAQIEGNPAWVTVAPLAGTVPEDESLLVSIDPALRPANSVAPDLLITVDTPTVSGAVQRIPIIVSCVDNQVYLPSVLR